MTAEEVLAKHLNRALDLVLGECRWCGYAEDNCICNGLCFYRAHFQALPCLEVKDDPADDGCQRHLPVIVRERLEDEAADR
jgi:hypothetical protein